MDSKLILVKVLSVIMFFVRIHLKYKASEGGKAKVGGGRH